MKRASRITVNRSLAGFTLVELMMSVVIIAILSAIAIPGFSHYMNKSRAQEAIDFLGVIKLRQESYRAEFGQYCDVNELHPAVQIHGTNSVAWSPATNSPWLQLGANPDGAVRFNYNTRAGRPADDTGMLDPSPWGASAPNDFWYWARATGDLNDDNELVTFEALSGKKNIWCSSDRGWD